MAFVESVHGSTVLSRLFDCYAFICLFNFFLPDSAISFGSLPLSRVM